MSFLCHSTARQSIDSHSAECQLYVCHSTACHSMNGHSAECQSYVCHSTACHSIDGQSHLSVSHSTDCISLVCVILQHAILM